MPTVSAVLYYGAPLSPMGREDDWVIDAVSRPPEVLWSFRRDDIEVAIADLRDGAFQPRLDDAGFEKLESPTRVDQQDLSDGSALSLAEYSRETAALLKSLTCADSVVFFDATLRREDTDTVGSPSRRAHLRVHIDQNPNSARTRAGNHGGRERRYRRFQIVNVWRPLIEPVRNFPLALCDYRSLILATDLVPTTLRFPPWLKDRENYSLKFNPNHRWYYWGSLAPDEVVVFKCYDSASRGLALVDEGAQGGGLLDLAGLCPHTAFFDESGPKTGCLRTSLEVRALLFYN